MSKQELKSLGLSYIPTDWGLKKFSEVTNLITCGVAARPEYVEDEGIPFLSSLNVKKGRIVWKNYKLVSEETHKVLTKHNKSLKGDILYTRVGSFGEAAVIEDDREFSIFVSLTLIKPKHEMIDNYYLEHLLNSQMYKQLASKSTTGLGVQNLNVGAVREFPIILPPINEQRKIASILSSVNEAIEKTEAIIRQTEEVKKGLIKQLLTRGIGHTKFRKTEIGEVPEEWSVHTLGDVTSESAFGPRFPADKYDLNGNYALLRTTDISEAGEINYGTMPSANLPKNKFQKHALESGDLLITRSGTCGIVCVFEDNNKPVIPGAFLIRFRVNNLALPQFLRIFMMSDLGQSKIQTYASGGVQKNLSGTNLKKLLIPLPTITEQKEIVETIKVFENKINNEKKSLQQLHVLKQGLMQSLLTGKVRVKIADAEVTQV